MLQMNSITGKLIINNSKDSGTGDYKLEVVELFKAGKIREGRQKLCASASADEMEELFTWMYQNLELWSATPEGQDEAILAIRKGAVNHSLVADFEINLSATLTELGQIS